MKIEELLKIFKEVYGEGKEPIRCFFSSGRVNLIGEHTDYNGGYVFPAALNVGTTVLARKRNDKKICLYATDLKELVETDIDKIDEYKNIRWGNYQLGVIKELKEAGYEVGGLDMLFHDTVPHGAGLSSSAAIECATGIAVYSLFNSKPLNKIELSFICQKAENRFVGVNCGIMDQFASSLGKKDHAIFLNTRTMEYKYVPLKLGDYKIVISNTNKKRSLADSKYNERRLECEKGLELLKKELSISCLGELDVETFEKYKNLIDDEIILKRVRHVVYEDDRVLKSIDVLQKGDLEAFGKLMIQSHISLRDDYEVTGLELDTLFDEALKIEGVIGSRMTGAGFGGCTVSIVHKDAIEEFVRKVGENYYTKTGLVADFYTFEIDDGAREIEI
ncbi:galactokinase [Caldicellulosiruptor obsidiansis OB47]|uniref:Galactokinase n=1 Tax=Caldicellulosiruptor obsidiansis (strain ATCC BAA-2073 / JCM 16842 / OB47) TaxID=608506 RepID=D9TLF7_CALOO|nr:galactokinase [Caldicellulosiruptor obsidiansis]ADL42839.1 galactokinase [Caldicellulosiruptor obsidiansis OB47]